MAIPFGTSIVLVMGLARGGGCAAARSSAGTWSRTLVGLMAVLALFAYLWHLLIRHLLIRRYSCPKQWW